MHEEKNLGAFLRKKRAEKNWAVYKLHRQSGVSTTYINQIEANTRQKPSVPILKKLATALDVPYETFMVLAGYITPDHVAEPQPTYSAEPNKIPILPVTQTKRTLPYPKSKTHLTIPGPSHPSHYAIRYTGKVPEPYKSPTYIVINPDLPHRKDDLVVIIKNENALITVSKAVKNEGVLGKIVWMLCEF